MSLSASVSRKATQSAMEEQKDVTQVTIEEPPMTCEQTRTLMTHLVENNNLVPEFKTNRTHLREDFLLRLMDICACFSAEKFSKHSAVTVTVDELIFQHTLLSFGELISAYSQVNKAWGTSMEIGVFCEAEDFQTGGVRKICSAYFTFVSLDQNKKKIRLPPLSHGKYHQLTI